MRKVQSPGELIRAFRHAHSPRWTQQALALRLKCSVQSVSAIENGRIPSHHRLIKAIERVVGIPPASWFADDKKIFTA